MSVRLPVITWLEYPKIAFAVFRVSSFLLRLIIKSVRLDVFMSGVSSMFHGKVSLVKILDYIIRPLSWWPSDWSHSHINSRYNHTIYRCHNWVIDLIFDSSNDAINLFSVSVGKIFSNSPIMSCTIFIKLCTHRIVDFLSSPKLGVGIVTNANSLQDSFNWPESLLFWCVFLRVAIMLVLTIELSSNIIKKTVLQQIK